MKLIDDGHSFYAAVAPRFDELAAAVEGQVEDSRVLRLHLGGMPLFARQRRFPRLPELRKQYPRLQIDIDTSPHLETRVGDTLDAAIIIAKQPDPAFHAIRLDHKRVYAITSHALAAEIGPTPDKKVLAAQNFLIHTDLPESFTAWKEAIGIPGLTPAAIDHYDSGQLQLEASANGMGIAIMHDDHFCRAHETRLAPLFDIDVESPYSYWFVCRPHALEVRAVRIFHDWIVGAAL
jgi:DNA-binding transcriptional LysR family regulator